MSATESDGERTQALIDQTLALHNGGYKEELEDALRLITDAMKGEYLEALDACPEVVKKESDPLMFLRRENFNCWAAAVRLVTYWRLRRKVFCEAAHLPLDPSGLGALNRSDIELILSDVLSLLPPDEEGRSVVCFDAARLDNLLLHGDWRRVCFYFSKIVAENPRSQKEGFVFLVLLSSKVSSLGDEERELLELLFEALPVKVQKILLVQSSPEESNRLVFLDETVPNVLEFVGGALERLSIPIHGESKKHVREALSFFGIASQSLPNTLQDREDEEAHHIQLGVRSRLRESSEKSSTTPANPYDQSWIRDPVTMPLTVELAGLQQLEEAISDMEFQEKAAYLEALHTAPQVVEAETPSLRFLRFEQLDPWAAARRLVSYWTIRKKTFNERFCLPFSLADGPSALNELDREILRTGLTYLSRDKKGRAVLFINAGRGALASAHDISERRRLCFLMLHRASEVTTELVTVTIISETGISPNNLRFLLDLISRGLPIRLVHSYAGCLSPKTGWRSYMHFIMSRIMRIVPIQLLRNMTIHITSKRKEMLARFEAAGFLERELPDSLGGTWTYEMNFPLWLKDMREQDAQRQLLRSRSRSVSASSLGLSSVNDDQGFLSVHGCTAPIRSRRSTVELPSLTGILTHHAMQRMEAHIPDKTDPRLNRDAVRHVLDQEQSTTTTTFAKAQDHDNDLVDKESPLSTFLLYSRNESSIALELQHRYWTTRGMLFDERALLPLNQTGEGALSPFDCKVLGEGFIVLLQEDSSGRPVVCINPSRILSSKDSHSFTLQRTAFYMGAVLSENKLAQTDGCVVLIYLSKISDINVLDDTFRCIFHALPVLVHSLILIGSPVECDRGLFDNSLAPAAKSFFARYANTDRVASYFASTQTLALQLGQEGLVPESLPECMGGMWSYERFSDWIDARIRYEWGLPTRREMNHGAAAIPAYTVIPLSQCSKEARLERTRRLHMLHSRRRRGRMKVEVGVLDEQVDSLRQTNKRLREENQQLEERLSCVYQLLLTAGERIE